MTKAEEKQRLRQTMEALERSLSERYRAESGRAIVRRLLAMPEYRAAGTVFCFAGDGREIDTTAIWEDALASGKQLCVPLRVEEGRIEPHQLGPRGSGEDAAVPIDEIDFAVLPCVTCNHLGQRLGRGSGGYDRFLALFRGGTVLLCREKLIREEIPVEPHDFPVPWVLTERGLWEDGIPARLG